MINKEERKIVAYHEIGHALVAMSLPGADPVQKITIIPRGMGLFPHRRNHGSRIAALGYTMQVPTEERFLMKKTELLNRISILLGGRAAEEIILGDINRTQPIMLDGFGLIAFASLLPMIFVMAYGLFVFR